MFSPHTYGSFIEFIVFFISASPYSPACVCASAASAMFSCSRYFPSLPGLPVPAFPVSWDRGTGEDYELLVEDSQDRDTLELPGVLETEESD